MRALEPLDEFHYHHRLGEAGGLALVLFSSPACGTCRVVEQRLPERAPSEVRLFKVDVQLSPGLARAHDVFHLPTMLLYRDGQFHARLDCEVTRQSLGKALEAALVAPAQEEP
jgi:thioredoxin-like negative regulator of GroEL